MEIESQSEQLLKQINETTDNDELLIHKLYEISFNEHLTSNHKIFLSSLFIKSDANLFNYLDTHCQDTKFASFRCKIIDFLKDFVISYDKYCVDYLEYIRSKSIGIYTLDPALNVKNKILHFTAKIIESNHADIIEKVYKPVSYLESLLNEIRCGKLKPTVKGNVWYIIGLLMSKFSIQLQAYKFEVHDVLYNEFISFVDSRNVTIKALSGMLKAYKYLLEDNFLKNEKIEQLYIRLKSLTTQLDNVNTIKINILALEVLSIHGKVFTLQLQKDSLDLFDKVFKMCSSKNQELKTAANEAIEKISLHISDCLLEDSTIHKDVFNYLLCKIKEVLESKSTSIMTNTAISLVGIFANAIVRFMGEKILTNYLEELIVICDKDIFTSLGKEAYRQAKENYNVEGIGKASKFKPSKSIKYILSIQKQYISLLNSYANIIANLSHISELFVKHFYNVLIIGFSTQSKFYSKYKERLCDAIAGIIINLKNFNLSFIRKTVKNGFFESIRVTENMLFKENSDDQSLSNSVDFWIMLLTRDKTFTEYTVTKFFDQLMNEIFSLIESLDVSYEEKTSENNNVYYEAVNVDDLEIYTRTSKFISEFVVRIYENQRLVRLFTKWVIISVRRFISIANKYPRIAVTYRAIGAIMKFCDNVKFFPSLSNSMNEKDSEIEIFKNEFKAFDFSLIKKIEIFQDELLLDAIEMLLSVPPIMLEELYIKGDQLDILKELYKKSFEVGINDIYYSNLALNSLENLLHFSEPSKTTKILTDILPIFGDSLQEYEKIKTSLISSESENEKIEKYAKIQNSIFDILGRSGGNAHMIISNNKEGNRNKNIVNIINSKKISYQFPLYNKKYNIHFDNLLTKIADIAMTSLNKERKFIACELIHSLCVYIIGKQNDDYTTSLIFLLEKIIHLACDLEKGISVIFETLLFQIVHWMSKKGSLLNNKDVLSMLDIIIDSSSSRKNLKLREISSQCIKEYIAWFIKQHSDITIKEKSSSIKYLIRKIESNAMHPDPFKRLGSAICLHKIIEIISNDKFLTDKFLLEIIFYVMSIIKGCHINKELNEVIFGYGEQAMKDMIKGIQKNYRILSLSNPKRNVFKSLSEVMTFLIEMITAKEVECAFIAQKCYSDLFNIEKREKNTDITIEKFWEDNNAWPQIDNNGIIGIDGLQFILWLHKHSIEIERYRQFNMDSLIHFLMNIDSFDNLNKAMFIYIVNIALLANEDVKKTIKHINNKTIDTFINKLIEEVKKRTNSGNKMFIVNDYKDINIEFILSVKLFIKLILNEINVKTITSIISAKYNEIITNEDYIISDSANEFFFSLISNEQISQKLSNEFISTLKEKLSFLIEHIQPKYLHLIHNLFDFLFMIDFEFVCELLGKNQLYFDAIASYFLDDITNDSKSSMITAQMIESFIKKNCDNDNITIIFIILERATFSHKKALIDIISKIFTSNKKQFDKIDMIVNVIKITTMLTLNGAAQEQIALKVIDMYITNKSINVIKEVLNLLGVVVSTSKRNDIIDAVKAQYKIIQSRYFPINTRCLVDSNESNEFALIFDCLLSTFKNVKSFSFLEILFPILREENTVYWTKVKSAIKEYVEKIIATKDINEIQKVINVFLDVSIDNNIRDNIRFTLMKMIGFKFIKKCNDIKMISDVFINNFEKMKAFLPSVRKLEMAKENAIVTYEQKFIYVLEATIIFDFFTVIFNKIPSELFKNEIHHAIYGASSEGKEITKVLIGELHNAKRHQIEQWEMITTNINLSQYSKEDANDYINKVENRYYCSAYNCLCALIKLTQTKVEIFNKFLFTTLGEDKLFDLLISSHFKYNFPIETNFYTKSLEKKDKDPSLINEGKKEKSNDKELIIDSIVSDSFFHDMYGNAIKETLMLSQRNVKTNLIDRIKENIDDIVDVSSNKKINDTFEEDYVNKHPIMRSIMIILSHLDKITQKTNEIPSYLQLLSNEMNRSNLSLNQKIFFIKVILNKSEIFIPYISSFISLLVKFTTEKNQCGKGFNYFIRDIATFILSAESFTLEKNKENIVMMSSYITSLMKLCGDTKNIIFRTNLKIINDLMKKFNKIIYLDKKTITSMLSFKPKDPSTHIWRITAIQILASAIEYDVPLGDDTIYSNENETHKFINSLEKNKEIIKMIISQFNIPRTPLHSATLELLGKILLFYSNNQPNDGNESEISRVIKLHLSGYAMSKDERISVNTIFRCCLHYYMYLYQKEIFNQTLVIIRKQSVKNKYLVMSAMNFFVEEMMKKITHQKERNENNTLIMNNIVYINDVYYTLFQSVNILFIAPSDEMITSSIGILKNIIKLQNDKFTDGIIKIVTTIQRTIPSKSLSTKENYYNFLIEAFRDSFLYDINLNVFFLNVIIINFDIETDQTLSALLVNFFNLNNNKIIPSEPVKRLIYLLSSLNAMTIEKEGKLILLLTKLLLVLIYTSSDFDLPIYEKGLEECVYRDLNVNTTGYYLNRSQPLAPSIMMRNTMDEAYETLVAATLGDAGNSQNFIKATISNTMAIKNNDIDKMDIEEITNTNRNVNLQKPISPFNISNQNMTLSQQDILLSQHSSLVNTTANYPSMASSSNKNVNFGLTHGEAFKVPYPVNMAKRRNYRNFFNENDISYTPVDNTNSTRIRFVAEGAERTVKGKKSSVTATTSLVYKWINRQSKIHKNQVKLVRHYRIGDLPDIQIKNRDILEPLAAVCNDNEEISCELFLEIITSVYKEAMENGENEKMEKSIENMLKNYNIDNYIVINCLHRVILDFMRNNIDYIPDLEVIKKTGVVSKNYHTAILIFEEFISNSKSSNDIGLSSNKKNKRIEPSFEENLTSDIVITQQTKHAWAYLLQFYSRLHITDIQKGLLSNFAAPSNSCFYIKADNDFLYRLSSLISKPNLTTEKNIYIANLLKSVFEMPLTEQKNNIMSFPRYNSEILLDDALSEVIEDYTISSCADLNEWDNINNYMKSKKKKMIKASMYSEMMIEVDDNNDSNAYYNSLYYVFNCDFDRAYLNYQKAKNYFYKIWMNLGKYTNSDLKHEVIEDIQKIYEVGEFIDFIKGTSATNTNLSYSSNDNEYILSRNGINNLSLLVNNYLHRWPSYIYDSPSVYSEILASRKILFSTFQKHIANFNTIIADNPVIESFECKEHIEIANALYKQNCLDIAGKYIKTALNLRSKSEDVNMSIVYPVLKNKCKLYEMEGDFIPFSQLMENYSRFIAVSNSQLSSIKLNDEIVNKILILQVRQHLMRAKYNMNNDNFRNYYGIAKNKFNEIDGKINEVKDEGKKKTLRFKLMRPMIKFCDYIIRNNEIKKDSKAGAFLNEILKLYMEYGLISLSEGDIKMINIIPKLLDILHSNQAMLMKIFLTHSMHVDMNYYLTWKNQLMAYVNTDISELLFPIIENILKKDPQSLFYSFTTIEKYSDIFSKDLTNKTTKLFNYMKLFYSESTFDNLNGILEAFDCLTNPEHKIKFWIRQISIVMENPMFTNEIKIEKIESILNALEYDVFNTNKKYIGNKIGSYNKKFAFDFKKPLAEVLTMSNIRKIIIDKKKSSKEKFDSFNTQIEHTMSLVTKSLNKQTNESNSSSNSYGIEKLSTFCEWLSQYENNDTYSTNSSIMIPSSSLKSKKIKISSFDQHIIVLSSNRLPKKIVIYGSDEKSYSYLIKGCEDMRLDQRIEEIFKVMNGILTKDASCARKKISLNTFEVVPMTQKLGMIEWINDTTPLNGVIKYSMQHLFGYEGWDIKTSTVQKKRLNWYSSFAKYTNDKNLSIHNLHYIALHSLQSQEIIKAFQSHENLMPKGVLKKALMHYLSTPEEILSTRINFMRNYSALQIASYILGIGDRHLENFLINIKTSKIVGIDFGVAFGQGLNQLIPELVPYRMTCQIRNVMSPFGIKGVIRQTMIDCLSSFKSNKENILDYCEVFVKEPLLEWGERSIRENVPMRKVEVVSSKLGGKNPVMVMIGELERDTKCEKRTLEVIKKIIDGDVEGIRIRTKKYEYLDVETQIDVLNEMATDPNLLGRMWIGWSPFI